jgi:hemolysin activation/secretion protein
LGTKFSGRNRQNIIFTNNNLLTLNDRAIGRFVISERHDFIGESVSYVLPLDARGTTANFNFSNVNLKLGKSLKRFEIRGHSLTFGPSLTFPILMTPHWEVDFNAGLDITSVKTKIGGAEDSNDQLRPIRFGPNISQFDKWGRTVFTSEFSQGFSDWLGASAKGDPNSSRADAGGQYFIWSTGFARFQRFFFDSILVLRANTQFTQFRLVSSEEYRLGGMETVRGYPEGDYLSDKGYNYTFEFRIPLYFIPKDFTILKQKIRDQFQLVGFVDQGRGWVKNSLPGELARKTLTGVGGGVLVDLFGHASGRVYFAQAVGDDPSDGDQFRLHFILTSEF